MLTRRYFLNSLTAGVAGINLYPSGTRRKDRNSFLNIIEAGAKGDGITDDTEAIQEAIDYICKRGGGKIFFPYRPEGYKIAKPAVETVDGKLCRGQLYFKSDSSSYPNIYLEGEHPCSMLYT